MKKETVQVKSGYLGAPEDPTREEIKEAGYDVKESSNDLKYYAVSTLEVDIPETLEELLEVADEEQVASWALSKFKTSQIYDVERRKMDSILRKEVPAECKKVLEALQTLGLVDPDELTFEQKSDLEFLKTYFA